MKTVLAFGDSLTRSARLSDVQQWPAVMGEGLGADVLVHNLGLGGRTTTFDDGDDDRRNGLAVIGAVLSEYSTLDLMIIMLGSNDLKPKICGKAEETAKGMRSLVDAVRDCRKAFSGEKPNVLVVSPPHFGPSDLPDGEPRGGRSIAESRKLAPLYEALALETGSHFADASKFVVVSRRDGVHLDQQQTQKLGRNMVPIVSGILEAAA